LRTGGQVWCFRKIPRIAGEIQMKSTSLSYKLPFIIYQS